MAAKKKTTGDDALSEMIPADSLAGDGIVAVAPKASKAPKKGRGVRIDPSELVPDMAEVAEVGERHKYWLGVMPDCPVEHIGCAGLTFSKINQSVRVTASGETQRSPMVGCVANLSRAEVRKVEAALKRMIIRFTGTESHEELGTGKNIGDAFERPRSGVRITIPTKESIEAARKAGKNPRTYVPQPGDKPAAHFMFMVPGDRQSVDTYPDPISVTGIEWPGESL